jgi:hypothetical protein
MKIFIPILFILLLLFSGFLIFMGGRSMFNIGRLVVTSYQVAQQGVLTDGELIQICERGYGRGQHDITRYKFFVEGYSNPRTEEMMKHLLGEDYLAQQSMTDEILGQEPKNGDWVYGEHLGRYKRDESSSGNTVPVTYLETDPLKNLVGDQQKASLWNLFGLEWIWLILHFLSAGLSVFFGGLIISSFLPGKLNCDAKPKRKSTFTPVKRY